MLYKSERDFPKIKEAIEQLKQITFLKSNKIYQVKGEPHILSQNEYNQLDKNKFFIINHKASTVWITKDPTEEQIDILIQEYANTCKETQMIIEEYAEKITDRIFRRINNSLIEL